MGFLWEGSGPQRISKCTNGLSGGRYNAGISCIEKRGKNLPKPFFIFFILLTAAMILCAVFSVFIPRTIESGKTEISIWMMAVQLLIISGSVISWSLLLTSGKERRAAYGLKGKNWKRSFLCILLFFYCTVYEWGYPVPQADRWKLLELSG